MVIVPVTFGPHIEKDCWEKVRKLLKLGKIDPHGGKCSGGKCNPLDLLDLYYPDNINILYGTNCVLKYPVPKVRTNQKLVDLFKGEISYGFIFHLGFDPRGARPTFFPLSL